MDTFKHNLWKAFEEGLLLFAKWGLVVGLIYISLIFGTQIINGANNGTQAAIYLSELQSKGWLPKIQNGQVPLKPAEKSNEETVK